MSSVNIGIDTGGTYTDAVVVDLETRHIAATAKAITTHGNLSIGVKEALDRVIDGLGAEFPLGDIKLVSLSTTLATNALVEGRGSKIASILIGFDDAMVERSGIAETIPGAAIVRVDGGHSHSGDEASPLDERALRTAIEQLSGHAGAVAISARYSVRNPAHEQRAREIVAGMTDCPITVSCDLSEALNGPRRALTASLNARIVSRIVKLIDAVTAALAQREIAAPLMMVKGDGSLVSVEHVLEAPIETILSGPAASVIGARFLSRRRDFIVSDIGGTTTDIAIARGGWPRLSENGSEVGGYRTLVQAIDMRTAGLGGDSEVEANYRGQIELKSNRVVPVSLLGARWPSVTQHLRGAIDSGKGLRTACRFVLRPDGRDTAAKPADLTDEDRDFLERVGDEPVPYAALVNRLADEKRVAALCDRGLLQMAGFTPSDAAHALGLQEQWSQETAGLACLIAGKNSEFIGRNEQQQQAESRRFARLVLDRVIAGSTHLILEELAGRRFARDNPLIAAVSSGHGHLDNLGVELRADLPLVAVGGPAQLIYPSVGKRLRSETLVPEHSEVANAVGAAAGLIRVRSVVEITRDEDGAFHVHGYGDPVIERSGHKALETARRLAIEHVEQQAIAMGGHDLQTESDVRRIDLPNVDEAQSLIGATVTAECTSTPW